MYGWTEHGTGNALLTEGGDNGQGRHLESLIQRDPRFRAFLAECNEPSGISCVISDTRKQPAICAASNLEPATQAFAFLYCTCVKLSHQTEKILLSL